MHDSDGAILRMECPCCGEERAISKRNLGRIVRAAQLRNPELSGGVLDLSLVPKDIDLTEELAPAVVGRLARLAVRADPPTDGASGATARGAQP